eukprot:TRINITY_DN702_c0_g1_i2.p1 TRINITY_DN702_c0_g1~~TRINITY_DN702_c0_g1_i2.p1  ORF type:complete len:452 (-),score=60.63 TRINITY_DN702_c0_g1_i2:83-1438(-)
MSFLSISVCTQILPLTSCLLAATVVAFAFSSGASARSETSEAIMQLAEDSARHQVLRFFDPILGIANSVRYTIHTNGMQNQENIVDFAQTIGPHFADNPGLLAMYMARSTDRRVNKFNAEVPGSYTIEERIYESQTAEKCTWARGTDPAQCTKLDPSEKKYDVHAKGWYKQGLEMKAQDEARGDGQASVALVGPETQSALAEGDITRSVFNMIWYAKWTQAPQPDMLFKAKFLTSKLSSDLNTVDIGANGRLFLVNRIDGRIVALNGVAGSITDILTPSGDGFHTIWSYPNPLSTFSLSQVQNISRDGVLHDHNGDSYAFLAGIPTLENFVIVADLKLEDFIPQFNTRIVLTLILAISSLILVGARMLLVAFLRYYHGRNRTIQAASMAMNHFGRGSTYRMRASSTLHQTSSEYVKPFEPSYSDKANNASSLREGPVPTLHGMPNIPEEEV